MSVGPRPSLLPIAIPLWMIAGLLLYELSTRPPTTADSIQVVERWGVVCAHITRGREGTSLDCPEWLQDATPPVDGGIQR
jgi:hypothetical protein